MGRREAVQAALAALERIPAIFSGRERNPEQALAEVRRVLLAAGITSAMLDAANPLQWRAQFIPFLESITIDAPTPPSDTDALADLESNTDIGTPATAADQRMLRDLHDELVAIQQATGQRTWNSYIEQVATMLETLQAGRPLLDVNGQPIGVTWALEPVYQAIEAYEAHTEGVELQDVETEEQRQQQRLLDRGNVRDLVIARLRQGAAGDRAGVQGLGPEGLLDHARALFAAEGQRFGFTAADFTVEDWSSAVTSAYPHIRYSPEQLSGFTSGQPIDLGARTTAAETAVATVADQIRTSTLTPEQAQAQFGHVLQVMAENPDGDPWFNVEQAIGAIAASGDPDQAALLLSAYRDTANRQRQDAFSRQQAERTRAFQLAEHVSQSRQRYLDMLVGSGLIRPPNVGDRIGGADVYERLTSRLTDDRQPLSTYEPVGGPIPYPNFAAEFRQRGFDQQRTAA